MSPGAPCLHITLPFVKNSRLKSGAALRRVDSGSVEKKGTTRSAVAAGGAAELASERSRLLRRQLRDLRLTQQQQLGALERDGGAHARDRDQEALLAKEHRLLDHVPQRIDVLLLLVGRTLLNLLAVLRLTLVRQPLEARGLQLELALQHNEDAIRDGSLAHRERVARVEAAVANAQQETHLVGR